MKIKKSKDGNTGWIPSEYLEIVQTPWGDGKVET